MKLPKEIRERFRSYGSEGGRARAARLSRAKRQQIARLGVTTRWIRCRFGADRFEDLGLPGGDLIDRGLADLAADKTSVESLLVSLARPRLRRAGVPVAHVEKNASHRLYDLLSESEGDLAHARYTALLRRAVSFADACHLARRPANGA